MFIRQIARDNMLWAACLAPLLVALISRFGLPYAETLLCDHFQKQTILSGYYLLSDLLVCLTPSYMLSFASAMVMLTERDENMSGYIIVTTVGKSGYMLSRLVFPGTIAFFFSILLICFFALTEWNFLVLLLVSLLMSLSSISAIFLIVSFSRNRVEGMAIAKAVALIFSGLVVPFFVRTDAQYLAALLPTFWIARLSMEGNVLLVFPALAVSLAWVGILARRFKRKLY